MASLDSEFGFLASSVERTVALQRARADVLEAEAGEQAPALLRHLVALYEAITTHVKDRRADFAAATDSKVKEGAITEMREFVGVVRALQSTIAWVDAVLKPPLDLGTTYFVERAARRLVAAEAQVIVVAAHEMSYATPSVNPYASVIRAWGDPLTIVGDAVIVVFIPRREEHSGLLHPLIIHELAHGATDNHDLVRTVFALATKRKRLQRRFAAALSAHAAAAQITQQEAAVRITGRLSAWITEALCDAMAAQYLGPTYLYSFIAEVAAANMDSAGDKHPPPRQRIGLLFDQLDKLQWTPVMATRTPALDNWGRALATDRPTYGVSDDFLVWAIDAIAPDIRQVVSRHVGAHTFTPDVAELDEVALLIKEGIPPGQRANGNPTTAQAIMLGSWLHALQGAGGGVNHLPTAADADELATLLPKSLEMTALLEAW